jgi:hypothetical protein
MIEVQLARTVRHERDAIKMKFKNAGLDHC